MRVVVAGGGSVGTFVAGQLSSAGHEVIVIEKSRERLDAVSETGVAVAGQWLAGDACEPSHLAAAGLDRSDVLVAVTGDDEDNLVISLLGKQEFGVPRVIARVNYPSNEWMFDESWGVDVSVSTPHLLTGLVEESVTVGELVRLMVFEHGRIRLVETTLADDTALAGVELGDLALPREATPVAVIRAGHLVRPFPDVTLAPGDEVLVLVEVDLEAEVRTLLTATR